MGRRSFIRDAFASTLQQTALSDATNTLSATYRATAAAAAAVAVAVGAVGKQESEVVAVPSTATPSTTETFSGEAAKSLRHMRLRQRALEYYAEFVDFQRRLKGRQPVSVQQLLDLVDTTNTVKGSADRAAFKLVLEQFVLFFVQSNIQRNEPAFSSTTIYLTKFKKHLEEQSPAVASLFVQEADWFADVKTHMATLFHDKKRRSEPLPDRLTAATKNSDTSIHNNNSIIINNNNSNKSKDTMEASHGSNTSIIDAPVESSSSSVEGGEKETSNNSQQSSHHDQQDVEMEMEDDLSPISSSSSGAAAFPNNIPPVPTGPLITSLPAGPLSASISSQQRQQQPPVIPQLTSTQNPSTLSTEDVSAIVSAAVSSVTPTLPSAAQQHDQAAEEPVSQKATVAEDDDTEHEGEDGEASPSPSHFSVKFNVNNSSSSTFINPNKTSGADGNTNNSSVPSAANNNSNNDPEARLVLQKIKRRRVSSKTPGAAEKPKPDSSSSLPPINHHSHDHHPHSAAAATGAYRPPNSTYSNTSRMEYGATCPDCRPHLSNNSNRNNSSYPRINTSTTASSSSHYLGDTPLSPESFLKLKQMEFSHAATLCEYDLKESHLNARVKERELELKCRDVELKHKEIDFKLSAMRMELISVLAQQGHSIDDIGVILNMATSSPDK